MPYFRDTLGHFAVILQGQARSSITISNDTMLHIMFETLKINVHESMIIVAPRFL
jgi:hypothetical protein